MMWKIKPRTLLIKRLDRMLKTLPSHKRRWKKLFKNIEGQWEVINWWTGWSAARRLNIGWRTRRDFTLPRRTR